MLESVHAAFISMLLNTVSITDPGSMLPSRIRQILSLRQCVSSETVSVLRVSESMCVLGDSVCPYSQCVSSKSVRQCLSSESVCVLRDRETVCVLRDSVCPYSQCLSSESVCLLRDRETVCVLRDSICAQSQ